MTHSTLSALIETSRAKVFNEELDINITGLFKVDLLPFALELEPSISDLLAKVSNDIIKNDLKTVAYKEEAKFFTRDKKELNSNEFFTYYGGITDEDGKELPNLSYRLQNYTKNGSVVNTIKLIKLIVQHHIAKMSNWQDPIVFYNEIKTLLKSEDEEGNPINIDDVIDFIEVELDDLIIKINEIIYDKDWYVFNAELKGSVLSIIRFEDWRAYKWSLEQKALKQAIEDQKKEDETGRLK